MSAQPLRDFSAAYLAGEAAALPFVAADFRAPQARAAAVERALTRAQAPGAPSRAALVDALQAVAADLPPDPARERNLRALRDGAACVVTGQQVGLFLGPLYTLHKTLAAVANARALEAATGTRVVPAFWLQTEDHDLPEIATAHLPRPSEAPWSLTVPGPAGATGREPVGGVPLGAPVTAAVAGLEQALAGLPSAGPVLGRLRAAYRPDATWSQAFARTLAGLLTEALPGAGVVFVDPRHPAVAALGAGLHRRALTEAASWSQALVGRTAALEQAGYRAQVHVREGAPLAFFAPDGGDGPRYRLAPVGGGADARFELVGDPAGRSRSLEALRAALEEDPRALSTSALLRPLYQDTLLPTAAYVGGPGELNYFAQLDPLYDAAGLGRPLFVPRARFRLMDRRAARALDALGLGAADMARPWGELLGRVGAMVCGDRQAPDALQAELLAEFSSNLEAFEASSGEWTGQLARAVARTRRQVEGAVEKLSRTYGRVLAQSDAEAMARLRRTRSLLAPEGNPQERVFGYAWFAARHGEAEVARALSEAIEPFDPTVRDVVLD